MLFCTSCGKGFVSDEDSFCRYCGTPKFSSPGGPDNQSQSGAKAVAQLRQATNSLLRRVGKVNVSKTALSKRFPKTTKKSITQKKFLRELDSPKLANYLDRKFALEGYETMTTGTPDDLYIELAKRGSVKVVSRIFQPVTIHVEVDSESTTITLGRAKWGEKAAMQKFGSIVFLPLSFSRTYGLTQDGMPEKIWNQVNQFIDSKELGAVEEIVMEGHGQAVDPRFFGGRSVELGIFETRLESTIQGRPRHLAVTGESGIGKSSTLRKYEQLAKEHSCLTIRRELDSTLSNVKDLSSFLLEALRYESYAKLSKRAETWDKTKDFFGKRSFSVTGPGLGSISVGSPTTSNNVVLQESFFKEATRLWTQLNKSGVSCVVFLIDEGDQLQNMDGGWRFVKSVFTRLAEAGAKFMLVIAGSADFLKPLTGSTTSRLESSGNFSPIERFLQPIVLKAMSFEEINDVLRKALAPAGRTLSPQAAKRIFNLSGGQPYIAQNVAFVATSEQSTLRPVSANAVDGAVSEVSENLAPYFSDRFDYLPEGDKRILIALATFEKAANVREMVKKLGSGEASEIPERLRQLSRNGLVREPQPGQYNLFSELFGIFLRENILGSETKQSLVSEKK